MHKIVRAYTMTPSALQAIESLTDFTGLDASAIVSGSVEATWAAVQSRGHRKFPSVIKAFRLIGPAKSGFYIKGEMQDEPR
jgi:hypothetical protein